MAGLRAYNLTRVQHALLLMLQAGLWDTEVDTSDYFPLTDDEWQQLFFQAERQTVQGVVFDGLSHLPTHLMPPESLRWTWMAAVAAIEASYRQAAEAVTESHRLLTSMGADVWLQKGLAVAQYYNEPQHRVNGDVDWYVHSGLMVNGQWPMANDFSRRADDSLFFEINNTEIELHPYLFDLCSSRGHRIEATLLREEASDELILKSSASDALSVRTPGPLSALLLLSTHILKHVTTRGIGLRQFCDMARAYHALHGRYDAERLIAIYRELGLQRWHMLLQGFLADVLATPTSVLPSPTLLPLGGKATGRRAFAREWSEGGCLLRSILQWGNFGQNAHSTSPGRLSTAVHIASRLPFSLRYAPRETLSHICQLTLGQRNQTRLKT